MLVEKLSRLPQCLSIFELVRLHPDTIAVIAKTAAPE